jgi:hypothetical protein
MSTYPFATDLATVEVPVVCSYGERSPHGMLRLVRALATAVPTATTRRIDGAGDAAPFDATINLVQLIADTVITGRSAPEMLAQNRKPPRWRGFSVAGP